MKQAVFRLFSLPAPLLASLTALILGACSITYLASLPEPEIAQNSAIILSIAGAVYIGFGLVERKISLAIVEALSAIVFGVIAIIGAIYFPLILGIGFLFHALWDCLHHHNIVKTKVVYWYPPFCAIYDCIVGIFLLVVYLNY